MTTLVLVLFAVVLVAAASLLRARIDALFPAWKGWRTVILNAVCAGAILAVDVVGYLAGFSWDAVLSAKTAATVTLVLNVLNVALRFLTSTPVGAAAQKPPVP
ncbi:MAG: hypothetical protein IT536_13820 [Hyphomicrobiales bacterium]|nr:hypothetical protein [Hyphomicrobiales bacterium]